MRRAVVDVGSNSVLLLVAELRDGHWEAVAETTAVTALGEGAKESGVLSEAAMGRTLKALEDAFSIARQQGADETLAAGTMALRISKNAPDFLVRCEAQGTPVEVLSGEEEAELGFRAVADDPLFGNQDRLSIIDVGGHSTELTTAERNGADWEARFSKSFPVGTLGLRGVYGESLEGPAILRAAREVDDIVGLGYRPAEAGLAVSLGATGTNLVSIRDQMTVWDPQRVHGATLDYEEISKAAGWLSRMSDAERAQVVGMEPGRERTVHYGALILERFLYALRAYECKVSVRGWRYALLARRFPSA